LFDSTWLAAGAKQTGTWTEVFGDGAAAEEVFMAWHFARFTQHVAAAGKAEYPLPMFVNAALVRPGYQPGQYPSAGPLPHLLDVWRAGAPAIDFIAPESAGMLLAASNDVVAQLTPLIVEHHGRGTMAGLLQEHADSRQPQQLRLNGYVLSASFERSSPPSLADGAIDPVDTAPTRPVASPAGGLVIATAADEFVFAGIGVTVTFAPIEPGSQAAILSVEEGRFVNGTWENVRWLNGDQTHQGRHLRLEPGRFSIQRIKLYRYR
jgi:hypothetical protein